MKTIEDLLAQSEILDVQMRYCRAADRVDFDLFRTCFHPDAQLVFSFFSGGVDEFIAMAAGSLSGFVATTHATTNHLVTVDGDRATPEFCALATHRIAANERGPERDYITAIRYLDRMERRDGEWRISRRQCILDWARTDPVPEYCEGAKTGEGRRDREDPSYQIF